MAAAVGWTRAWEDVLLAVGHRGQAYTRGRANDANGANDDIMNLLRRRRPSGDLDRPTVDSGGWAKNPRGLGGHVGRP
jgi:hypothetical protein